MSTVTYSIKGKTIELFQEDDRLMHKPLYRRNQAGKTLRWRCWVIGNQLFQESGQLTGKKILTSRECKGKNIGRKNETSDHEQAIFDSQTAWNNKVTKLGYTTEIPKDEKVVRKREKQVKNDVVDDTDPSELGIDVVYPMLATNYNDVGHRMNFPCIANPKLDGNRGLARLHGDKAIIHTRSGKLYKHLKHIKAEAKLILELLPKGAILDGELYIHGVPACELSGIARSTTKPHPKENEVEYWVYDCIIPGDPYFDRICRFRMARSQILPKYIKQVDYVFCNHEKDVEKYHRRYTRRGFEGLILRDSTQEYQVGKRHWCLQKYKKFQDAEYEILDVLDSEGREKGCARFLCKAGKETFTVRPVGTLAQKKKILKEKNEYIGKLYKVKFQHLSKLGIPVHPVGLGLREVWDM